MYALGIDIGTTFTAAATWRDGHVEVAPLGSRASSIPSVVLVREDGTVLTGETANRRGQTEPHRVAREFKRRLGDTTPILLGGAPYSAEALTAKLLRAVIDDVMAREGDAPDRICVSHPANWGAYKLDLLNQAVRLADIQQPVVFASEPESAAVFYAHQRRIDAGAIVAVYDLGGGTFDAAVLRKTDTGFQILGQPEGIERLGGIDFDAAVFDHVSRAIGGRLAELDEDDTTAIAAVARLREECVQAKEALSADTDCTIPVLLPNLTTEVRLTRGELETMVNPALHSTIEALNRALRSADVTAGQLHSVLLVGGSSRIPLVAQLVGAELNRPVTVDAHPKFAVASGAAHLAAAALPGQATAAGPGSTAASTAPPAPQHAGKRSGTDQRPRIRGAAAVPSVATGTGVTAGTGGAAGAGVTAATGSTAVGPAAVDATVVAGTAPVSPAAGMSAPGAAATTAAMPAVTPTSPAGMTVASTAPLSPAEGTSVMSRTTSYHSPPGGSRPPTTGAVPPTPPKPSGRPAPAGPPSPPTGRRSGRGFRKRVAVLVGAGLAVLVLLSGALAANSDVLDDLMGGTHYTPAGQGDVNDSGPGEITDAAVPSGPATPSTEVTTGKEQEGGHWKPQTRTVEVPPLQHESVHYAKTQLSRLGLHHKVREATPEDAQGAAPDTVIWTEPSAGTPVEVGKTVTLVVAPGGTDETTDPEPGTSPSADPGQWPSDPPPVDEPQ